MPYKIVTHDVDLEADEQEMAVAILEAGQQADIHLTAVEAGTWRLALEDLVRAVRTRVGRAPGGMAGPLPGGKQMRFYRVEHVSRGG